MMRGFLMLTWILSGLSVGLQGQETAPDPLRHFVSREALAELLVRWEGASESQAYSDELRVTARVQADEIRTRLDEGDFRVGDRLFVSVAEDATIQDTFTIEVGPILDIPNIGAVSLTGVLRVEVEAYLTEQISRFVRTPTVRARALLPVTVTGAVTQPGFHTFASSATLREVLRSTGLSATAKLDDMVIRRDDVTLWEGDRIRGALTQGLTLDELGLRAGDELFLPIDAPSGGNQGLQSQQIFRMASMLFGIPFALFGIARTF